jgi:hypothetical protein
MRLVSLALLLAAPVLAQDTPDRGPKKAEDRLLTRAARNFARLFAVTYRAGPSGRPVREQYVAGLFQDPAAAEAPPPSAGPEAPPQAPQAKVEISPEERARLAEELREALGAGRVVNVDKLALAHGRACAIPLTTVMPPNAQAIDKKMILPAPRNSRAFAIRQISPPAPPCDEEAWRGGAARSAPNAKP